jgi:riboflavin synthase
VFSGIVEEVGQVIALEPSGEMVKLVVSAPSVAVDAKVSDSICVNGVCLTVTQKGDDRLSFDAVPETLSRSSLGDLKANFPVNLERSLAVGQRLGGHFVQGHVDSTATIIAIEEKGDSWEFTFETDPDLTPLLVEKGSIALDGISLTLARVNVNQFTVAVIPFTWEHTNLSSRKAGDRVNVEADILGKHVLRAMVYMQQGGRIPETLLNVMKVEG